MELALKCLAASFNHFQHWVVEGDLTEMPFVFCQTYSTSESAGPAEESEGQVIQVYKHDSESDKADEDLMIMRMSRCW